MSPLARRRLRPRAAPPPGWALAVGLGLLAAGPLPGCDDAAPVGEKLEEQATEGGESIQGLEEAASEVADEVAPTPDAPARAGEEDAS